MKKITSILVACTVMLFAWQTQAQIVQPTAGTTTVTAGVDFVDGDTYTDSGDVGGNYGNNELGTLVFQATAGEQVAIDFTAFDVEASGGAGGQCWDNLTITGDTGGMDGTYAGDNFDAGAGLACLDGTDAAGNPSLGPFTSADGGTLTFLFDSDGSVPQTGWEATISVQPAGIDPNGPVIACPMDLMVDSFPGECSAEVNFATPVALDPNGGTVTVTQTMGPASGDDFPVGDTIVEFTATNDDAPNEVTTCQFTVTVNDIEPPMITCPDNITVDNEAGLCGATVMYPDPIVMDNCFNSGVSTVSDTLGTIFATNNGLGAGSAVYFDVTTAGNDLMVTSLDMNTDDVGPITIEMWTRTGTSVGNESDPTGWALAGTATGTGAGVDNPSNVVFGAAVTVSASTTTGVALVFVDADNNYTNGDGTNESFSNADLTIDLGASSAAPFTGAPFSPRIWNGNINYDVMAITGATPYTVVAGLASGDFFPVGTTTNTLEYVDAGGNTVQCSFDVTVLDVEAPVITCTGGPTFPSATTSMVDGQAITDTNPTTTSVMNVTDDFDITDLNVTLDITHTWVDDMEITLTSPAGTSVVIFNVGCSGDDLTMDLDDEAAGDLADCTTGVNPAYPDPAYVPSNALSAFDGENTVGDWTLEVTDTAGGDDGTLNGWGITYETEVAGVGGPTVILDANGVGSIATADFIDAATDNCGIASITVAGGPTALPVNECGDNIGGLITTGAPLDSTATIAETGLIGTDYTIDMVELDITHTFNGDLDIELISPAGTVLFLSDQNGGGGDNYTGTIFQDGGMDITAGTSPFTGTFAPEGGTFAATFDGEDIAGGWILRVTDNFGGDDGTLDNYCITFTSLNASLAFFGCEDIGTNTIDIAVTDPSGNVTICTSTVTVLDETAPILVCQDVTVELDENGEGSVVAEDLLAETEAIFDIMSIGSNNGSGGFGSTDFTVPVTDAATVTFDWDYTTVDAAGFDSFGYLLNGTYTELTDPGMANQSGSGSVAVAPGDVFGFRSDTVDNTFGGNETIISNFMPGYEGQFDQANWNLTLDNSDGDAFFVLVIPAGPLSFDACGIEVLAINTDGLYTCDDIGMTFNVQVFASDASNNASVCTSVVTVVDALAPVLTCPEDHEVATDPDTQVYTFPDYFATGEASAVDNCTDVADIVTTQDPAPGTTMGISDGNVVTITATDASGNTSTCTFEVDILVEVLGLEENELNAAITMYPNPANNQVTISNGSNIALNQAVIYDTNGKLINTIDLRAMQSEQVIDVASLASGIYMIQISSENATIVKRLIKQ